MKIFKLITVKKNFLPINLVCLTLISGTILISGSTMGQTIRFVVGTYDCFTDTDCLKDKYSDYNDARCDLQTHKCVGCHGDQVLIDNECGCPDNTYTYGNYCISCSEPDEIYNEKGACICNEKAGYHRIDGSCQQCPADKPLWDGNQCVECMSTKDCNANYVCEDSINYVCTPCPSNLIRDFEEKRCHCPTNPEMGLTTQNNGEPICMEYCPMDRKTPGVILIIDRSGSTKNNGFDKWIDSALEKLKIPDEVDKAIFYGNGTNYSNAAKATCLNYGSYTYDELTPYFKKEKRGYVTDPEKSCFSVATREVADTICTGQKLIVILWTDAEGMGDIEESRSHMEKMKKNCPGSIFYLVAPKNHFISEGKINPADRFFYIKELNEDYSRAINDMLQKEACIDRTTNKKIEITQ